MAETSSAQLPPIPETAVFEDWEMVLQQAQAALSTTDQLQQPTAAAGLHLQSARAFRALKQPEAALQALDQCLVLEPTHPAALSLRAAAHQEAQRWQSALFDLLKLQEVEPDWPNLLDTLQVVARHCAADHRAAPARSRPPRPYARVRRPPAVGQQAGAAAAGSGGGGSMYAYAALGLAPGVGWGDVRAAYKQLVTQWHPDKHTGEEPDVQAAAQLRFQHIQAAYEHLKHSLAAEA